MKVGGAAALGPPLSVRADRDPETGWIRIPYQPDPAAAAARAELFARPITLDPARKAEVLGTPAPEPPLAPGRGSRVVFPEPPFGASLSAGIEVERAETRASLSMASRRQNQIFQAGASHGGGETQVMVVFRATWGGAPPAAPRSATGAGEETRAALEGVDGALRTAKTPGALSRAEARLRLNVGLALARDEDPRSVAERVQRPLETLENKRGALGLQPRGIDAEGYVRAIAEGRSFDR